jgi:hypothetical protein
LEKETIVKKTSLMVVVIGVTALLSGLPASAQNDFNFQMTSSFYAGNAKMPPGTYSLRQMGDEEGVYELQDTSAPHSVMLETRPSSKTAKGKTEVVFNRYGDTDYLEAILTSGGTSVDIMPSTAEKIAAKKGAPQPHSVVTK